MASNPPGRCCTIGVKHEGEAKGELKTINGSMFPLRQIISISQSNQTPKSPPTFPTPSPRTPPPPSSSSPT